MTCLDTESPSHKNGAPATTLSKAPLREVWIDADTVVFDSVSLATAISSSLISDKLPSTEAALFSSLPLDEAAKEIFEKRALTQEKEVASTKTEAGGSQAKDLVVRFGSMVTEYSGLVRPLFGAADSIRTVAKTMGIDSIIFLTRRAEVVGPLLKGLLAPEGCWGKSEKDSDNGEEASSFLLSSLISNSTAATPEVCKSQVLADVRCIRWCAKDSHSGNLPPADSSLTPKPYILSHYDAFVDLLSNAGLVQKVSPSPKKADVESSSKTDHPTLFDELAVVLGSTESRLSIPRVWPTKVQPLAAIAEGSERALWGASKHFKDFTTFEGLVVKGFGRGSAQLGIPTANLSNSDPVDGPTLPIPGVYFGTAMLWKHDAKKEKPCQTYKMVMSAGYNPYYDNAKISVEAHIFHDFGLESFIDSPLKLVVKGMLRAEANFTDFGHLIAAIQNDCEVALLNLQVSEPADK